MKLLKAYYRPFSMVYNIKKNLFCGMAGKRDTAR